MAKIPVLVLLLTVSIHSSSPDDEDGTRRNKKHEFPWLLKTFQGTSGVTWSSNVTYGDSIAIKCPTKKDQIGLGLKSFSLYFLKNPASNSCTYNDETWEFAYTCDTNAEDENPDVYNIVVAKASFPGGKSFKVGDIWSLIAMENVNQHVVFDPDEVPIRADGDRSTLCESYKMVFTFTVNENHAIDESDASPTDLSPLPYDPIGDNETNKPSTPKPFDDRVLVDSFDDIKQIWPILLGVLIVLALIAFGIACCLVKHQRKSKNPHQETIETIADIRDVPTTGGKWSKVREEVPTYLSNYTGSPGLLKSHPLTRSMDQLRRLNADPTVLDPMLTPPANQPGMILGDGFDPTMSWQYRRGNEVMFKPSQNSQTCKSCHGTDNNSTRRHRAGTAPGTVRGIGSPPAGGHLLASPNDTGCESGSIDSHETSNNSNNILQAGDTVLI